MKTIKISFLVSLILFFSTNLYCQTGSKYLNDLIKTAEQQQDEKYNRDHPRETYTPPPPKYIYNGVEYSTEAARDAAKKAAEETAKKENFIKNEKTKIDAGFKSINSTNNNISSGFRSIGESMKTNSNTSSGFREIGESMNRYVKNPTNLERSAVAISDKVMHGAKTAYDVITDPRVRETADAITNLSGKNVLLLPIDKSTQKMNETIAEAMQQKAGYERGSAKDKAVTLAVSSFTDFAFGHVKQEISDKYFPDNKNPRLFINQTPRQEANIWKENAASYLGVRGKAIGDAVWYGKNTPVTISDYMDDLRLAAAGKITTEELWRRTNERWKKYAVDAAKRALTFGGE